MSSEAAGPAGVRGVPTLLLTTTGRRTGELRRTALIYGRDGADYVIVAANGGATHHPDWYLNLVADPKVSLQVGSEAFEATAHSVDDCDHRRLWPELARIWPDYDNYQANTDRRIPIVVLSRV